MNRNCVFRTTNNKKRFNKLFGSHHTNGIFFIMLKIKKLSYISLFLILLISLIGLFSSCRDHTENETSMITFDSIVVQEQIPLILSNDTTLPFSDVHISFIFPKKFRDNERVARIRRIFIGTFFGNLDYDSMSPEKAVDSYLEHYREHYLSLSNSYYEEKKQLGKPPMWYWYSMSHRNRMLFQGDSLLGYEVEYRDYEGGAHDTYRITYTNIDLNRLVTLTEEDLFIPGYYNRLSEAIIDRLMKKYGVKTAEALNSVGFLSYEDIAPNNNFWLNDEGIHYAYNAYEIAPYAMGVIKVTIPYSQLSDILLPDGIIERYFLKEGKQKP